MSEQRLRDALVETNKALGFPLHTEPTQDERDTWGLFADALSQRLASTPVQQRAFDARATSEPLVAKYVVSRCDVQPPWRNLYDFAEDLMKRGYAAGQASQPPVQQKGGAK